MKRARAFSKSTLAILRAMADQPDAERYGYELMKTTGLKSGTLYPILMRLSDQGLLEARWRPPAAEGRPARHAYRLTSAGLEVAAKSAKSGRSPAGAAKRSAEA
ncbi:MAG: PadR family transcriptional regulator [Pseudomonadota bacterium]